VSNAGIPTRFALHQNYPNPFNPETNICYDLPTPSRVTLEIFDALGRKVRTLLEQTMPAGRHSASWNAQDDEGNPLASGMYFGRLVYNKQSRVRKMMWIR
jgi:hypothetical protein